MHPLTSIPIKKVLPICKCLSCSLDSLAKKTKNNDEDSVENSIIASHSLIPYNISQME